MIVKHQKNIKVHFAGCEELQRGGIILNCQNHKYSLFTIFPFICDALKIKHGFPNYGFTYKDVVELNDNNSYHCIQDSGLFSLMFGSFSGTKDKKLIELWINKLIELTSLNEYKGTVVEIDCQKLFGVDTAWTFREKLKKELPNNRIINVFHKEDGQKGLDKLIEFSDYIAISVPELRAIGQKNYTEQIAHYIKNKKPNIDIHLLGCTENKMLRELNFCSSSDSTSWVSINRYGWFKFNDGKKTHTIKKSNINKEHLYKMYRKQIEDLFIKLKRPISESSIHYHCCYAMQVDYLIKQYTVYAGPQD